MKEQDSERDFQITNMIHLKIVNNILAETEFSFR